MIPIAKMQYGRSPHSGREYFRGRDRNGTTFWLLRDLSGDGWTLKVDLAEGAWGPLPEPGRAMNSDDRPLIRNTIAI